MMISFNEQTGSNNPFSHVEPRAQFSSTALTVADFNASQGDKIWIDKDVFNINSLGSVLFNDATDLLSVNGNAIATLDNHVGFDVNAHITLMTTDEILASI